MRRAMIVKNGCFRTTCLIKRPENYKATSNGSDGIVCADFAFMVVPGVSTVGGDTAGPGVDWSGCSRIRVEVSGINMTEANLIRTNLTGARMVGTILVNTAGRF